MDKGKKCEIFIEDDIGHGFILWADPGFRTIILSIEGIISVTNIFSKTNYHINVDPRYDLEWIKQEVIAQIKIGGK